MKNVSATSINIISTMLEYLNKIDNILNNKSIVLEINCSNKRRKNVETYRAIQIQGRRQGRSVRKSISDAERSQGQN